MENYVEWNYVPLWLCTNTCLLPEKEIPSHSFTYSHFWPEDLNVFHLLASPVSPVSPVLIIYSRQSILLTLFSASGDIMNLLPVRFFHFHSHDFVHSFNVYKALLC